MTLGAILELVPYGTGVEVTDTEDYLLAEFIKGVNDGRAEPYHGMEVESITAADKITLGRASPTLSICVKAEQDSP